MPRVRDITQESQEAQLACIVAAFNVNNTVLKVYVIF